MELAQPFIGRRSELEALRNLHRQPGCHIAVVYGRRRVGKTALVNHAYAGEALLSFEGLENKGKQQQIRNFIFQLERQTPLRLQRKDSIREWREALAELVPLVSGKRVVVLLDELQWMANYRSDLVSDLKMVWEQYLCKAGNITLVLCGSIAFFMEQKVLRSKALYGNWPYHPSAAIPVVGYPPSFALRLRRRCSPGAARSGRDSPVSQPARGTALHRVWIG
jgi:uncharacterized protein